MLHDSERGVHIRRAALFVVPFILLGIAAIAPYAGRGDVLAGWTDGRLRTFFDINRDGTIVTREFRKGLQTFMVKVAQRDAAYDANGDGLVNSGDVKGLAQFIRLALPASCGNGSRDIWEQCDDGDADSGDGCSAVCEVEDAYQCRGTPSVCTRCGDGIIQGPEECENSATNGCGDTCRIGLGALVIDDGDAGFSVEGTTFDTLNRGYGNDALVLPLLGTLWGSATITEHVSVRWTFTNLPRGNYLVEIPWNDSSSLAPPAPYHIRDGDALLASVEAPQPTQSRDRTRMWAQLGVFDIESGTLTVTVTNDYPHSLPPNVPAPIILDAVRISRSVCGDGIAEAAEQCDDGNVVDGDGCSARCGAEYCGDTSVDPGEQCDDGNLLSDDGCTPSCKSDACGNGILETSSGEACDDGNTHAGDACSPTCALVSGTCGDGILQAHQAEECDDGNRDSGDGCSASCKNDACPEYTGVAAGNGFLLPAGDTNGDRHPDIIVVKNGTQNGGGQFSHVELWRGDGKGRFAFQGMGVAGYNNWTMHVSALQSTLYVANAFSARYGVNVKRITQYGFTDETVPLAKLTPRSMVGAWVSEIDTDLDGDADSVFCGEQEGLIVLTSEPQRRTVVIDGSVSCHYLTADDVDRDGDVDLVVYSGNGLYGHVAGLELYENNGRGIFRRTRQLLMNDKNPYALAFAAADLNGDGRSDIVLFGNVDHRLSVLLADTHGWYRVAQVVQTSFAVNNLTIADVTGDGNGDVLAMTDPATRSLVVYPGTADGALRQSISITLPSIPAWGHIAALDVDADGDTDLAYVDGSGVGDLWVLRNDGRGSFPSKPYPCQH